MRILASTLLTLSLAGCPSEEESKSEPIPTKADDPSGEISTPAYLEEVEGCLNALTNTLIMTGGAIKSVNSKNCDAARIDVDEARKAARFTESVCTSFSPEVKLIIDKLLKNMVLNLEVLNDHFADECERQDQRRKCDLVLSVYRSIAKIALEAAKSGNCELVGQMANELGIVLERTKKDCSPFLYSDMSPEVEAVIDETQAISDKLIEFVEKNCPGKRGLKRIPEKMNSPSRPPSKPSKNLNPLPGHTRDIRVPSKAQNSRRV